MSDTVDPRDRATLRRHLERFGRDVVEREDGTLAARFRGSTEFAVDPAGRVEAGMPLHQFDGVAEGLVFDHEAGTVTAVAGEGADAVEYTFRAP
ncbi:hypothetical protein [Halomicrobium salinisoli]|uniref:hypothetical protein n=1 Tax=Halomicrobium salinisoli TaxID=2878391 RepID=UPI001CF09E1A|nr:hypothetical protein [Halomicrobium salinisoli]